VIDPKLIESAQQCPGGTWRTVATNLTGLYKTPSFHDELLTQVTNGTQLEILKEDNKWSFVRQEDGYLGWIYSSYLAAIPYVPPTHFVIGPVGSVWKEPNKAYGSVLLGGTKVLVSEVRDEWARVEPAGEMLPAGWSPQRNLRKIPSSPNPDVERMLEDARRMTGAPYLWGGNSAFGIDCSGLVQLVHRLAGYTLPRDADMQFDAGREVKEPFHPGDLLFFGGESTTRKITHVGISLGGWRMIHSSRARNGVYEDDVQAVEHLRTTLAGARSFLRE
jgi:cell wall-associated NlpC family hydrolase